MNDANSYVLRTHAATLSKAWSILDVQEGGPICGRYHIFPDQNETIFVVEIKYCFVLMSITTFFVLKT